MIYKEKTKNLNKSKRENMKQIKNLTNAQAVINRPAKKSTKSQTPIPLHIKYIISIE